MEMIELPNQDEALKREPAEVLKDLAEAASRNLFTFAKGVLGYKDLSERCHGPLCVWHDTNPARYKLTLMPRGHLKTTIVTISKTLQRIVRNPEERILLANETATNAERFLAAIRAHAEGNRKFRTLYSWLIPAEPKNWSQQSLTFNRQGVYPTPTIDAIGMTGAYTSRHYTHLTFDDPISEEAARSPAVMEDVIARIGKFPSLMDDPSRNTMDIVGTRWAFYDVYSYLMGRLGDDLARYIRPAIEDGEPIWPERFSLETLAQIRNDPKMGEYSFSCLYLNSPRNPEVQDFNVEDLKYWRWSADEKSVVLYDRQGEIERVVPLSRLDITVTVDVRYGERLNSDRDAIVVCGATEDGALVVLEAWAKRSSPLEVVSQIVRYVKRYAPRCVGIQKVGYEMSLKWYLKAECDRQGVYVRVVPVKPGGPGKTHIRGLQPIASTGRLYLLPTHHVLRNELAEYPLGQYDDVADALALHLQLLRSVATRSEAVKRAAERYFDEDEDEEEQRYGPMETVWLR